MIEERLLMFLGGRFRLTYNVDGTVEELRLELHKGPEIVIRSKSGKDIPEQIFELLRECEVQRNDQL